jgi:hypothetical protein
MAILYSEAEHEDNMQNKGWYLSLLWYFAEVLSAVRPVKTALIAILCSETRRRYAQQELVLIIFVKFQQNSRRGLTCNSRTIFVYL